MFKNKIINIFVVLFVLFLLAGCQSCNHENVNPATCTEDGYCQNCNEMINEALGHDMKVYGNIAKCSRCNMDYVKVYFTNIDALKDDQSFYIETNTLRIYKFYEPNSMIDLPTPIKIGKTFIKWQVIELDGKKFNNPIDFNNDIKVNNYCVLEAVYEGETIPHTHYYIDGKCECGETDPNTQQPHKHNYNNGICSCGITNFYCSHASTNVYELDLSAYDYCFNVLEYSKCKACSYACLTTDQLSKISCFDHMNLIDSKSTKTSEYELLEEYGECKQCSLKYKIFEYENKINHNEMIYLCIESNVNDIPLFEEFIFIKAIESHQHQLCDVCGYCTLLYCDGSIRTCNGHFEVYYYDLNNPTVFIGKEEFNGGAYLDRKVGNYIVVGDYYTKDGTAWRKPITENLTLYAVFVDESSMESYTYNDYFASSPSTFNPLDPFAEHNSAPLNYTTSSFYEFDYNSDQTGYNLIPVMASKDPVDVTYLYAVDDKYGIKGETSGYAYRIALNKSATWENGERITADDYIYTIKALLDYDINSDYASSNHSAITDIANALTYYYSKESSLPAHVVFTSFDESVYNYIVFRWDLSAKTRFIKDWIIDNGYDSYINNGKFGPVGEILPLLTVGLGLPFDFTDAELKALDGKTYAEIISNPASKKIIDALFELWCVSESEKFDFFEAINNDSYFFEDVGIIKVDDFTLDIVYNTKRVGYESQLNINLPLVYEPLYESLLQEDDNGLWSTTYGTSVDTYMSYGPYKLTKYVVDDIMVFERNYNWFGYQEEFSNIYGEFVSEIDGQIHRQFETTRIVLKYEPDPEKREEMFLSGQLDQLVLNSDNYNKYKYSIRLNIEYGSATQYGIILSDYASLVKREAVLNGVEYGEGYDGSIQQYNKTILTIKEFRQAINYAINRNYIIANLYPGGSPATSLYSNLIIADPDKGLAFNSFSETKEAICKYWGVKYGPGEEFTSLEDAYKSITGYNLNKARELVNIAVKKAIDAKLMGPNTIVRLDYCSANDADFDKKLYNIINECLINLFKGTLLEGKFIYDYNADFGSSIFDAMQSGLTDTVWGYGWTGSEFDPYYLFQVYCDAGSKDDPYQFDMWINRNTPEYNVTVEVNGENMTYTVYEWYQILNGIHEELDFSYLEVDSNIRVKILAACELRVLQDYTYIPLVNQGSLHLLSHKCNYGKVDYVFGMGYGGIRYLTYSYNDLDWEQYVASRGGNLSYS